MKNKTVIILLSVFAVMLYTVVVINFCMGDVLSGISNVLMASSLVLLGKVGQFTASTANALAEVVEMLSKGVPAKITVMDGKETFAFDLDEDDDDDDDADEDDGEADNTDDNESGKKD